MEKALLIPGSGTSKAVTSLDFSAMLCVEVGSPALVWWLHGPQGSRFLLSFSSAIPNNDFHPRIETAFFRWAKIPFSIVPIIPQYLPDMCSVPGVINPQAPSVVFLKLCLCDPIHKPPGPCRL